VLAGAVSRWRWLLSAVGAALVGAAVLMLLAGFGMGLGAGIALGEPRDIWRLTLAGAAFLPAMVVMAGVGAVAVATKAPWIAWLAVAFVIVSLYLGPILQFPQWVIGASPIGRTSVPLDLSPAELGVMVVTGAVLAVAGAAGYRRRDAA
jgi:ABC-2 type transport system permease protein